MQTLTAFSLVHEQTLANRYLWLQAALPTAMPPEDCAVYENNDTPPDFHCHERILQVFWNEQRFTQPMKTRDGQIIEVLNQGTWNVAAGPDFCNALIRIQGVVHAGDVEIHRHPRDWVTHGHDADPRYRRVILHVVWSDDDLPNAGRPPLFSMQPAIPLPWPALVRELDATNYPYAKCVPAGRCAFQLAGVGDTDIQSMLATAGHARLIEKAQAMHREAVAKGFAQALYEAVFRALGYSRNQTQFQTLAAAVPLEALQQLDSPRQREALLLGEAGFLPDVSVKPLAPQLREHVTSLWDCWWRLGRRQQRIAWQRAGIRPANRPERRLAAGIAWLEACNCQPDRWLLDLAQATHAPDKLLPVLERAFVQTLPWNGEATAQQRQASRGLGRDRIHDILVNAVLPFYWAAGIHHRDDALQALSQALFRAMPRLQHNRRFEEAAHRLLVPASRLKAVARSACQQQGVLAIYQDFCQTPGHDCHSCPFGTAPLPLQHTCPP